MNKVIKEQTKVYKGREGWQGETLTFDKSGQQWEITTSKGCNGGLNSSAMKIDKCENDGLMTTTVISGFCNPKSNKNLINVKCRVTEKVVREQHAKAVLLFDELDDTVAPEPNALPVIRVGLNFFTDFQNSKCHKVIYKIEDGKYFYIDLENKTKSFENLYHLKPYSEKFGIGQYYDDQNPTYKSESELSDLLIEVNEKEQARKKANDEAKAEKERKINEGLKTLSIPASAQTVIVAHLEKDESDMMSDYHGSSTTKTVYLAWSTHRKNNFNEMRKAAEKCEDTKFLSVKDESLENRQNYSGGGGYFLGKDRYSGWKIKKGWIDPQSESAKADFALAITEGRFFCNDDEEVKNKAQTIEPIESEGIELLEYSEKACAIFGDTKPYTELLGKNGLKLRFNRRLTHPTTKEIQGGWVLPKKRLDEVNAALEQAVKTQA